jgi:hypothetical protein
MYSFIDGKLPGEIIAHGKETKILMIKNGGFTKIQRS